MKKFNFFLIILASLLVLQFGYIPRALSATESTIYLNTSQIPSSSIRIAIYDEANLTHPSYSSTGLLTNNHTLISSIFTSAGYDVSFLSTVDISNHKLMTAKYDIFVLNDNLPREKITDYVIEFWLGGGSLLSFDSAVSYLCYFGILPPESNGDEGFGAYWNYIWSENQSIYTRHPVSKAYEVSDIFSLNYYDWATFDWTALLGTSIAGQLTRIATLEGDANGVTILGFDPENQGGKVLHILGSPGFTAERLLIDACDWLCPRPKGRIAFDMTHNPRLGVDLWDSLTQYPGYYSMLRDDLVSRNYLFDKLYPSTSGNLTLTRLNLYDMLIVLSPDSDYISSDRNALTSWVNNGGGLLVFGENPLLADFAVTNARLNFLLNSFDITLNDSVGFGNTVDLVGEEHPSVESCVDLRVGARGTLNLTSTAYPIWKNGAHIIVAGQESQSGRIILIADMNWATNAQIGNVDNQQYAINVANWLISWNAKILLYTDEPNSINYYVTPVANALNQLGLNYYLTFSEFYFNLSLKLRNWNLVIVDNPWFIIDGVFNNLIEYLDNGGRLIMSSYYASNPTPLWARMGFTYAGPMPDSVPLYMWDQYHSIFTTPINFDLTQFTPIADYGDEGDLLTVSSNATALAGYTSLEMDDNAVIVLRNDKKTLYNGYLIDEFSSDSDDSTYPDNLELWINEIAYMWAQIPSAAPPGIPSYDTFILIASIFVSVSLVSFVIIKKHKNKLI